MMGGMRAVIWTDAIQLVVLVIGLFVTAWVIGARIDGGWGTVMTVASDAGKLRFFDFSFSLENELTLWASLLGGMVLLLNQYGVDQAEIQRFLTTSSVRKSQAAVASAMIFASVIGFGLFFIGIGLFVFYQQFPDKGGLAVAPDRVFPKFIVEELPTGLKGLLLAGVFSAGMSTVSSVLHSLSTVTMADFFVRRGKSPTVAAARWATIGFGVLCTGIALVADRFGNLLVVSTTVNNLFGGPLVGVFLLGLLTRRANGTGTCIGAAVGFASAVADRGADRRVVDVVRLLLGGDHDGRRADRVAGVSGAVDGKPAAGLRAGGVVCGEARHGAAAGSGGMRQLTSDGDGRRVDDRGDRGETPEGPKPVAITYGQEVDVPMPAAFHVFAARPADWDGDGRIDLLATPATGGAIYLLKNIGTPKAPRFDFPYAEPPLLGRRAAGGRCSISSTISTVPTAKKPAAGAGPERGQRSTGKQRPADRPHVRRRRHGR